MKLKMDTGKEDRKRRFQKISEFVVEKSSPQKEQSDEAPAEQEAEAIAKFRKHQAKSRGKSTYEDVNS